MIFAGIGAHATGVRAGISFESAFVILHRKSIDNGVSVTKRLKGKLFTVELLFHYHRRMPRFEHLSAIRDCLFHRLEVLAKDLYALAASKAIRLDNEATLLPEVRFDPVEAIENPV